MNGAATETEAIAPPETVKLPSMATRYYVLFVLMLVSTVSILDRQILNILLEPIREELKLSDSQMGVLTGFAFAAVYTTVGIPIARLADRWSRRNLVAIAIIFWSGATMVCGTAQSFFQLFLSRIGVAAGEAGGSPPAHALVSDLFPRERRATAMSLFLLCSPLGFAAGLLFGGWALGEYGWRWAFILAGVPGLLLGPIVYFTFREYPKGLADGVQRPIAQPPFLETLRLLWSIRTLPNMVVAATLQTVLSVGLSTWIPAFLMRSHGFTPVQIGGALGLAAGLGLTIGTIGGGPLLDWLGRRELRLHFWIPAFATLLSGLCALAAFLAPPAYVFLLFGLQLMLGAIFSGPLIAITTSLAPIYARATASACVFLALNLVGMGLGPLLVGVLSDALKPSLGQESLRAALLCATAVAIPAAWFYFRASLTYRADMAAAELRNKLAGAA